MARSGNRASTGHSQVDWIDENVSALMIGLSIRQDRRIKFLHSPRIAQGAQDVGAYLVVDEADGAVGHDEVGAA